MKSAYWLLAAILLVGPTVGFGAQGRSGQPPAPPLVDADHRIMPPEAGLTSVRVLGDAAKPGMYVSRNRFAPGQTSRPHYHDHDRYITVIKGTWWVGVGDVYDVEKMMPIKTGGFMFHPAGYHHYDGAKDDDVIVQIMGLGPVKTTQTEIK